MIALFKTINVFLSKSIQLEKIFSELLEVSSKSNKEETLQIIKEQGIVYFKKPAVFLEKLSFVKKKLSFHTVNLQEYCSSRVSRYEEVEAFEFKEKLLDEEQNNYILNEVVEASNKLELLTKINRRVSLGEFILTRAVSKRNKLIEWMKKMEKLIFERVEETKREISFIENYVETIETNITSRYERENREEISEAIREICVLVDKHSRRRNFYQNSRLVISRLSGKFVDNVCERVVEERISYEKKCREEIREDLGMIRAKIDQRNADESFIKQELSEAVKNIKKRHSIESLNAEEQSISSLITQFNSYFPKVRGVIKELYTINIFKGLFSSTLKSIIFKRKTRIPEFKGKDENGLIKNEIKRFFIKHFGRDDDCNHLLKGMLDKNLKFVNECIRFFCYQTKENVSEVKETLEKLKKCTKSYVNKLRSKKQTMINESMDSWAKKKMETEDIVNLSNSAIEESITRYAHRVFKSMRQIVLLEFQDDLEKELGMHSFLPLLETFVDFAMSQKKVFVPKISKESDVSIDFFEKDNSDEKKSFFLFTVSSFKAKIRKLLEHGLSCKYQYLAKFLQIKIEFHYSQSTSLLKPLLRVYGKLETVKSSINGVDSFKKLGQTGRTHIHEKKEKIYVRGKEKDTYHIKKLEMKEEAVFYKILQQVYHTRNIKGVNILSVDNLFISKEEDGKRYVCVCRRSLKSNFNDIILEKKTLLERMKLCSSLCRVMNNLHKKERFNLNLKNSNVLVDSENVFITDVVFDISLLDNRSDFTAFYSDPRIRKSFSEKSSSGLFGLEVDVYSFGFVLLQMYENKVFKEDDVKRVLNVQNKLIEKYLKGACSYASLLSSGYANIKIATPANERGNFIPETQEKIEEIILKCLSLKYFERPTIVSLVKKLEDIVKKLETPEVLKQKEQEFGTYMEEGFFKHHDNFLVEEIPDFEPPEDLEEIDGLDTIEIEPLKIGSNSPLPDFKDLL